MNIIGCLDSPSLGRVTLDGLSLDSLSLAELTTIRREAIGLIFQQFHLISYLTALENVMVAQYYHSLVDEKEALEALERVGLSDRAKHLPRQLSGGEQQRVCIARALINHPKILLADEPTGNLDETNENMVMDILHTLHNQGGTIIVVTHSPEVAAHAERTVVLEHGRVESDRRNSQAGENGRAAFQEAASEA
jgi:putative ABC transport system ATP-binding protein